MKKKILITLSIIVAVTLLIYVGLVIYIFNMAKQDTKVKSDAIVVLGEVTISGISCYGVKLPLLRTPCLFPSELA